MSIDNVNGGSGIAPLDIYDVPGNNENRVEAKEPAQEARTDQNAVNPNLKKEDVANFHPIQNHAEALQSANQSLIGIFESPAASILVQANASPQQYLSLLGA